MQKQFEFDRTCPQCGETKPISKFDLLRLVAIRYGKSIHLEPDESVEIDRSLSAERFRTATGYVAPEWPNLIDSMYNYQIGLNLGGVR